MLEFLKEFLDSKQFIPHGHCYLWKPGLVGLNIISDLAIALAYYAIPILLIYIVRKRGDLPFDRVFMLFGAFIIACGTGHLLDIWTLWHPTYWISGLVKAITAVVSLVTAGVLVSLIPKILAIPSPAQLEEANRKLEIEIGDRRNVEKMLQLVMDNIPQFIFWKDKNSVYLGCNRNFARAAGLESPENILAKTDYDLPWKREESDFFRECDARIMATDTAEYHIIETLFQADGKQNWVDTNKIPLHDAEGNVMGILGTYEDITERKLAQEAMQALVAGTASVTGDEFFPAFVRHLATALNVRYVLVAEVVGDRHDNGHILAFWSGEGLEENFSYDLANTPCSNVVERGIVCYPRNLRQIFPQVKLLSDWGAESYLGVPLLDSSGNTIGYVCILDDKPLMQEQYAQSILTIFAARAAVELERQKAETALRENEERYRAVVEQSSEGIFLVDADTKRILEANAATQNSLGYTEVEILQLTLYDIVPLEREIIDRNVEYIRLEKHCFFGDAKHRRKDRSIVDVEVNINIISYGGREVFCIVFRDVTDRKLAEDALRKSEAQLRQQTQQLEQAISELRRTQSQLIQTEKMSSLGQMVAGVAHEINNPVNFIYANLSYLEEFTQDLLRLLCLYQKHYPHPVSEIEAENEAVDLDFLNNDIPKAMSSMKAGANRIRQIVLSLRNFSRLDEAEVKAVNIHEGIDSTLLILQSRLKQKAKFPAIEVIKEYSNLPLVKCYAGQLNQVFMNIILNAIDAIASRFANDALEESGIGSQEQSAIPIIRIFTEVKGNGHVAIRITDNGCGMSEEVRWKLFDPFFTTKPVGSGTGLGLSVAYQIVVEKHGGQLRCISSPGGGAEFEIEIPIQQQQAISLKPATCNLPSYRSEYGNQLCDRVLTDRV